MLIGPRLFPALRKTSTSSSNTLAGSARRSQRTDLHRANYETTIADLMTGQHLIRYAIHFKSEPIAPRMFRIWWRKSCCGVSGLKGAACRQGWKTSLIATQAEMPAHPAAGADIRGQAQRSGRCFGFVGFKQL